VGQLKGSLEDATKRNEEAGHKVDVLQLQLDKLMSKIEQTGDPQDAIMQLKTDLRAVQKDLVST
jgi:hypothetical protein